MFKLINTHASVIWSLVIRQIQISRVDSGGFFLMMFTPLRRFFLLFFMVTIVRQSTRFSSYYGMLHFAVGIILFGMWGKIIHDCRRYKYYTRGIISIPRVTPLDIIFANALISLYVFGILTGLMAYLVSLFWGKINFVNWEYALIGGILTWLLSLGVGLTISSVTLYYPFMSAVFTTILVPQLFISGVIVDVLNLPRPMQIVAKWNPLAIGLQITRYGFGVNTSETYHRFGYMAVCAISLLAFGLFVGRHVWRTNNS